MTNITDNFDLGLLESKTKFVDTLINMVKDLYMIDTTLFVPYYGKVKANIDNIRMINSLVKSNPITHQLLELYEKLLNDSDNLDQTNLTNQTNQTSDLMISSDSKNKYVELMKPLQFSMSKGLKNICFENKKMLSTIRLAREISILSRSLPMDYDSSIYVRVDESNMQNIKALIIPASDTPYADGCFIFDIFIPETYPKIPPTVKIITTGNGSVRFNPNLYACGKVCLSLLGTWRGDPSESWNENSTLLQVLISIQSLIFIDNPYFNEPGYERTQNTTEGKKKSQEYNQNVKYNTVSWAMVDMLKNPPAEFESVILSHFKSKKSEIINRVNDWISKFTGVDNSKFAAKYNELCDLLLKLE
jgi:baculoviral IAP repeat-containing protein 6